MHRVGISQTDAYKKSNFIFFIEFLIDIKKQDLILPYTKKAQTRAIFLVSLALQRLRLQCGILQIKVSNG